MLSRSLVHVLLKRLLMEVCQAGVTTKLIKNRFVNLISFLSYICNNTLRNLNPLQIIQTNIMGQWYNVNKCCFLSVEKSISITMSVSFDEWFLAIGDSIICNGLLNIVVLFSVEFRRNWLNYFPLQWSTDISSTTSYKVRVSILYQCFK